MGYVFENNYYFDCTLSMGSCSSARCCQCVTSAIVYIFTEHGYFAINYLDDLGGVDTPDRAEEAFHHLLHIMHMAGLKESPEKSCAPSTRMVFLGIEVDTILLLLRIPAEKWAEIQLALKNWANKVKATKKQVQQLAGQLNFACKCVKPGRIYLSRILNFFKEFQRQGK